MNPITIKRFARATLSVQFLALVRILVEYLRLKQLEGSTFLLSSAQHYVTAGLLTAVCAWLGTISYFYSRYTWTAIIGVATVLLLLVYKAIFMS
jgi:hypothetical protein